MRTIMKVAEGVYIQDVCERRSDEKIGRHRSDEVPRVEVDLFSKQC